MPSPKMNSEMQRVSNRDHIDYFFSPTFNESASLKLSVELEKSTTVTKQIKPPYTQYTISWNYQDDIKMY